MSPITVWASFMWESKFFQVYLGATVNIVRVRRVVVEAVEGSREEELINGLAKDNSNRSIHLAVDPNNAPIKNNLSPALSLISTLEIF